MRFMAVEQQTGRDAREGEVVRAHPSWLALREPADAQARSLDLVATVRGLLPVGPVVVHDLGCGTGSMGRWLAPRLSGPQHWVLHDRDAELLVCAAASTPRVAADGSEVTVEARHSDVALLGPTALAGASLVTASALLDMMSESELDGLVASCAGADCPVLITLSVVGRVDIAPIDPLDERVGAAFNAHQRRRTGGRRLLGPDAVGVARAMLTDRGLNVRTRSSPWRLGPGHAALTVEWFSGWLDAACEQRPSLLEETGDYRARRLADAYAGRLGVSVHHQDLLAVPRRRAA